MSRWARRKDTSHPHVVSALEAVGASVQVLDGKDIPDLLVGYRGQTDLLELKSEGEEEGYLDKRSGKLRKTKAGELSEGQEKWIARWRGRPVKVVRTPEEALAAIGADTQPHARVVPPPGRRRRGMKGPSLSALATSASYAPKKGAP
jgi:hypothetical protein